MGICPRCGSWVDEGEPYCPECLYDSSSTRSETISFGIRFEEISVNGHDYRRDDVEEALDILGYDMDDFDRGLVDEDELEEVLQDL
jgi:uncharacterized protein YpuA (DUF1002 family)